MVKWDRLAESKSVVLFATTSVIQAVVLICLQLRIFTRNVYGWLNLNSELGGAADACLYSGTFDSFMILTFESVMFIFLYLFQLYVCISAVLHKNTIQVFMIALTNFCYVVLGVVQLIETKETHNKILNDCPMIAFDPEFMIREVPNIIMITLLAFVMGYLSFKLYKQFGWIIYKKIGDDIQMQSRYRTRLIFLMLLKLNLLMILLFSILIVPYSINGSEKTLVYIDFIFFMSVSLFNALAYKSITNEYKNGMNSFLTFWVIAMAVYGWFFYIGFSLTFAYKLYIGSIFGIFFLLLGVLTFVIGISVTKNFGKGLKEYLTIHKSGIKKIEEYEYKYDNNHNSNSNNNNI
ncbi:uncharacterized protein OCT59_025499 [Rhizophagus irregularis]|uniref:Uncharacterized protein n=2 Tax=Rhizophagus irregularis TaxID=588596 RepID=A0A015MEP2_RHIIW|nr:hypothetical protein GLOIN_2v1478074 [Rhizophagus irregularis DAOM 181602=DAOM 197198]EXX65268.1 hypothetical protein RirG_134950 [Rhizophagus irregularis DAOM 197198w]POG71954.1 hypothetical protein GLOIN_2v1478074 [Rhizophagus irregularis DAOM 181602=DAOM 197198]UZO05139.1 hypothetical protein OCT59_025499 [Rhizophagus irregularis]|eukprot:XP_025178820.1 hypothetical protein GLOIN_2v1478074 [Rhizophagus irregularis DAOM 181602=DAOM 197198]